MQHGDYQLEIYGAGLKGVLPRWPVDFAGLEAAAGASLPDWILNYVAGGAGDERTQRGNAEAFGWWGIVPRMMNGAYERDLSTSICGIDLPTPLFCCPIGVIGLCSQDFHGDLAVARACARTGVPMVMSTLSQDPLEDVAAALGDTPGFFQLYTPKDRDVAVSLIQRAEKAGLPRARRHPRHLGDGLAPARPQHRQLPAAARALPRELLLRPGVPVAARRPARGGPAGRRSAMWARQFGNSVGWDDLTWMREATDMPILLKGISHPDDARRAVDLGVDGLYCSNHGGRQANGGLPALETLPEVVAAAGEVPVLFDSGVRSGADVAKALALGCVGGGARPAVRVRAGPRGRGGRRAPPALGARRDRPDHGRGRLPDARRPPRGRHDPAAAPPGALTRS